MKPILFTAENRQRTRTGHKTQTRRVITDTLSARARLDNHNDQAWQESVDSRGNPVAKAFGDDEMWWEELDTDGNPTEIYFQWQAPCRVGEIRYVCEPYRIDMVAANNRVFGDYMDDGEPIDVVLTDDEIERFANRKHPYNRTPARFMYRSLARTFIEITDLRREPLQEISEADAQAEGVVDWHATQDGISFIPEFRTLWDSINARHGHAWASNPTVLVVEYRLTNQK